MHQFQLLESSADEIQEEPVGVGGWGGVGVGRGDWREQRRKESNERVNISCEGYSRPYLIKLPIFLGLIGIWIRGHGS